MECERKREVKIDSKVLARAPGSLELPPSEMWLEQVCWKDQDLSLGHENSEMLARCSGGKRKYSKSSLNIIIRFCDVKRNEV